MAKGDYVKVIYRTGVGVTDIEIIARGDGSKIDWDEPREKDRFVKIEVQKRAGEPIETYIFASADVVAIIEGHKTKAQLALPVKRTPASVAVRRAAPVEVSE
jgi:hypothetical protein